MTSREQLDSIVINRFWRNIVKGLEEDSCWGWLSGRNRDGYGVMWINAIGRSEIASRVSYIIHIGAITDGYSVLHTCDYPECTNPKHLYLGTARDNSRDAVARDRVTTLFKAGENHPNATLTADDVRAIRGLIADGYTDSAIAEIIGIVSRRNVNKIRNGQRWADVI